MSGWYKSYKGRSVGRVLHFVDFYCGLHIAERVVVKGDELFYPTEKDPFAKITWAPGDIPVFYFMPYDIRQTHLYFAARQVERLQEALQCSGDIPYEQAG